MKLTYPGWIYLVYLLFCTSVFAQQPSQEQLTELSRQHLEYAKAGHPHSQLLVSNAYAYGWGVPVNFKLSKRWLNQSLAQDYPLAFHEQGVRYLTGVGVAIDENQGVLFLQQAAQADVIEAMVALGAYYLGVYSQQEPIDVSLSKQYLLQAVKLNSSSAMLLMGLMYQRGLEPEANAGDDLNIQKAIYWLEKSAKQMNIHAIANLGLIYWHPSYQNVDYKKAYFWFKIAKLAGSSEWNQQRIETEMYLSKASRNKLRFEAEDWFKAHNKNTAISQSF